MYSKIVNPKTGRKVSTKGKLGQSILRNYVDSLSNILSGGSSPPQPPVMPMLKKRSDFASNKDYNKYLFSLMQRPSRGTMPAATPMPSAAPPQMPMPALVTTPSASATLPSAAPPLPMGGKPLKKALTVKYTTYKPVFIGDILKEMDAAALLGGANPQGISPRGNRITSWVSLGILPAYSGNSSPPALPGNFRDVTIKRYMDPLKPSVFAGTRVPIMCAKYHKRTGILACKNNEGHIKDKIVNSGYL